MSNKLLIIAIAAILFSCKDKISDKDKRNENWAWWVDGTTGKGSWIPVIKGVTSVKNGKYTRFYFNGNIFEKGKLVDGKNVDTVFNYDIKGNLQEYGILSKDSDEYFIKDGPIKIYYPSGSVKALGVVKKHFYGDQWVAYFESGKHMYVRNLKQDTGWAMDYYESGAIRDSIYVEGKNEFGLKYFYLFPVGRLRKSLEFKNHNVNGLQKEYYPNGTLKAVSTRVNGVFNGKQMAWYEDGHLAEISYKKDGELNGGPNIKYFENGKVKEIAYMKNDKFDGKGKEFDETGKLIIDKIFQGGVVIEDKLLDSIRSYKPKN